MHGGHKTHLPSSSAVGGGSRITMLVWPTTLSWNNFLIPSSSILLVILLVASLLSGSDTMAKAFSPAVKVGITASHDGGNIEVLSIGEPEISGRTAKVTILVNIKPDVYTDLEKIAHMQFFSFRAFVSGLHSKGDGGTCGELDNSIDLLSVEYIVDNAQAVSYPKAWSGTTVCYTSGSLEQCDDNSWRRSLSTKYVDGKLSWTHLHTANGPTFFSYWPLYTYDRHLKLIADCSSQISTRGSACKKYNPVIESLGQTVEGREIECISIGNGKLSAWIQHRQHPGEPMAEFFAEGLLHRLFGVCKDGELDEAVTNLLDHYRLYIIPNMCPDGSVLGHLRTNSVGANLNREWANAPTNDGYEAPTMERSPEVYVVLSKMDAIGCDFFLDVHGDEELPFVFFSGAEKTPVWGERIMHLHGYFIESYQRANSDVQKRIGYPPPDSEDDAMKYMHVATNQVSNRFKCLGLTLEMPFKDCETNPDPDRGFSPERAKSLGRNLVEAMNDVQPYLRAEGQFWNTFSSENEYVIPTDNYREEGFVMLKKRYYSDVRGYEATPNP